MSDKDIKIINAEKGDGKLTVKKEFKNEEMPQPQPASLGNTEVRNVGGNRGTIVVQGNPSAAPKFKFTFTNAPEGSGLLNTTFELAADEEKTFENLPYGTYTVAEEDTPDFQSEGSQWRVTLSVGHKEDTIVVTNYPKEPKTDFTAVKKWVGGKAEDHKKVTLSSFFSLA